MRTATILFGVGCVAFCAVLRAAFGAEPAVPVVSAPATDFYGDPLPPHALARLGTQRIHPESFVQAAAFSPDGRLLASAAAARATAISLWEVPSGRLVRRLTMPAEGKVWPATNALAFSPDGNRLLTGDGLGRLHLWNVATGGEIYSIAAHDASPGFDGVTAVAFSADGAWFASGGADAVARVWSTDAGRELLSFDVLGPQSPLPIPDGIDFPVPRHAGMPPGAVAAMVFSPDGRFLSVGMGQRPFASKAGKIRIWDLAANQPVRSIDASSGELVSLAFTPDGRHVISGGNVTIPREKFGKPYYRLNVPVVKVRVWEIDSGKMVRELATPQLEAGPGAIALAKDGRILAVHYDDRMILWDLPAAKMERSISVPRWHADDGLAISPDAQVVCAPLDYTIGLWSTATGDSLLPSAESHTSYINLVAYAQDGSFIATAGGDGTVRVWNAGTGQQRWSHALGRQAVVHAIAVSLDGALIAAGGATDYGYGEGGVRILRAATGEEVRYFLIRKTRFYVDDLAFSADGSTLAIARGRPNAANMYDIDLHDVESGDKRLEIAGNFSGVSAMAFSKNAKRLYAIDRSQKAVVSDWDTATGERRRQFTALKPSVEANGIKNRKPWVADATFSPDLKTVMTRQNRDVIVWDIERGEPIRTISVEGSEYGGLVRISPDGRRLAITDSRPSDEPGSDAIRIFDLQTERTLTTLTSECGCPIALVFSPDGTCLVTGMSDGTALVWDLTTAIKSAGE